MGKRNKLIKHRKGPGQNSIGTPQKLHDLGKSQNLIIEELFNRGKLPSDNFWWDIHAHAGTGWNEHAKCWGTPVVTNLVSRYHIEVTGYISKTYGCYCDKKRGYIRSLMERLRLQFPDIERPPNQVMEYPYHNRTFLHDVGKRIKAIENPRDALGLLVLDPDGPSSSATPWADAIDFLEVHGGISVFLNNNLSSFLRSSPLEAVSNLKRERGIPSKVRSHCLDDWLGRSFKEIIRKLPREHWYVWPRIKTGGNDFIRLVGLSYEITQAQRCGLYSIKSPPGQQIIQDADVLIQSKIDCKVAEFLKEVNA